MLKLRQLDAGYESIPVLHGLDLEVGEREFVAVLGPNGAGKSTLLRAISGSCSVWRGEMSFGDFDLRRSSVHDRAGFGISHVPEGRRVWPSMTVEENLRLGGWSLSRSQRREIKQQTAYVLDVFPRLKQRLNLRAGFLSGGEQQMLAIGRALMSRPKLILIDEPSTGLAPVIVDSVMDALRRIREDSTLSVLLVEQRIPDALSLCDRLYVLNRGTIQWNGPATDADLESLEASYFGTSKVGR